MHILHVYIYIYVIPVVVPAKVPNSPPRCTWLPPGLLDTTFQCIGLVSLTVEPDAWTWIRGVGPKKGRYLFRFIPYYLTESFSDPNL